MKRVLLIIVTAALAVSCYMSELSDTTHPDKGMVVINKLLPDDAIFPANGYSIIFNDEIYTTNTSTTTLDVYVEPGVYTLYVYSNTSEMSINDDIDESGNGTIISSKVVDEGVVESLTENLYFGTETITVLADEVIYSEVTLSQVTRDISFNIEITEGDPGLISSTSATLSGIAGQWECVEDVPIGDAVKIEPTLTLSESLTKSSTVVGTHLTGTIKVLGIKPDEEHILEIILSFIDGTEQHIIKDVSSQLSGSNQTKSTPIIISESIVIPTGSSTEEEEEEEKTDVSVEGDITDWEPSDKDYDYDANQPNE